MNAFECPTCKEIEMRVINTYSEVDELGRALLWDECECAHCHADAQFSRIDDNYDPPDQEGEPPISISERYRMAAEEQEKQHWWAAIDQDEEYQENQS